MKKTPHLFLCVAFLLNVIGMSSGCAHNPFSRDGSRAEKQTTALSARPSQFVQPTALTDEAVKLLQQAEQQIDGARKSSTLWSAALIKFDLAKVAAATFDSKKTMELAVDVIALCEQSAAQSRAPRVAW